MMLPDLLPTSDNPLLSEPKNGAEPALIERHGPEAHSSSGRVLGYVRAAVSHNTRRAYQSDLRHFLDWGGSMPATDAAVAEYLADHAGSLSVATLARRLAAICKAHTTHGLSSPTSSELVRMTMRGIRRGHGRPQRQVAAAVKEDILAMVAGLGEGLKDRRDRALILIGFAGAFRRSELVAVNCTDIGHVPQGIVLTIARGKTDQEGRGRRVGIPYARGLVCPVKALDAWLSASGIGDGPVFRSVRRQGGVGPNALSPEAVALIVKQRAAAAGLDPGRYSGHSLRAGLATSAARAGVPVWKIRDQTGHASDAMLGRYVREGELFLGNAAGAIL